MLVENHPDNIDERPQVGGGSSEKGGKDDGKGEEKPKIEAKVEAKEDSAPPKKDEKKEEEKEEKKPPEIHKEPDWTGIPPKIPTQRGGPEQSGSIGLNATDSISPQGE